MSDTQISKLLIDDEPLIILPKLASVVGLNQAIFLQQLHYWLQKYKGDPNKLHDGRVWIYNTYQDWQNNFQFWDVRTIRRIVNSLERKKLIIKNNYNHPRANRTIWYTINYTELKKLFENNDGIVHEDKMSTSCGQSDQMQLDKMSTLLSENTTETTAEKNIVSRTAVRDVNDYPKDEFLLRPTKEEFLHFSRRIKDRIQGEGVDMPKRPFNWLSKTGSIEGDLKILAYGNLPGCKTIEENDKKKKSILYDLYNIQRGKLNWLNFLTYCILYTIKTNRQKSITNHFAFTYSLLFKPATIISALTDGILKDEDISK